MELKEPRAKHQGKRGRPRPVPDHPLPIITKSNDGVLATPGTTELCVHISAGRYNGDCVVVDNPHDMSHLNSRGHFGKGTLSRSYPVHDKVYKGIPPLIRERQWKRRCSWGSIKIDDKDSRPLTRNIEDPKLDDSQEVSLETNGPTETTETVADKTMLGGDGPFVVVLNDSDSECDDDSFLNNLEPRVEQEPCSVRETLQLTLEEAFFLSYALGCLTIVDLLGNNLSIKQTWKLFMESQDDFVELYVVYHYFRAKGWVVKPGLKFGGDFLLYKQGPSFFHATYMVKVQVLNWYCSNKRTPETCLGSWKSVMGLSRLAETAAKELLICQFVWPADCGEDDLSSPQILSQLTVNEMLVRRWVAAQERDQEGNS